MSGPPTSPSKPASLGASAPGNDAGRLGSSFILLPARGTAATLLPLARMPAAGGEALLSDDALALDNRRVFAAGRAGALHLLLREDGPPSPLRLALEAGGEASGLELTAADAATLATRAGDADAIVIGDVARLGPAELQAVLDYHRSGGALLLAPGENADPRWWSETLLAEVHAGTLGPLEDAGEGAAWRLLVAVAGHPALAGFPARPGEPLTTARFQRVRTLRPGRGARVLAQFDRTHPALLETPHALVLSTPLGERRLDFAVSGAFLPLVHQCARVLARGTAAASLAPGEAWRAPGGTGAWRVEDETGREVPVALTGAGGAAGLTSAPLERPGLYRVWRDGQLRSSFAVNPDPRESDLAPLAETEIEAAFPRGRVAWLRPGTGSPLACAKRASAGSCGRPSYSWRWRCWWPRA